MSGSGVDSDEMRRFSNIHDMASDQLLAGQVPMGYPELEVVASFLQDLVRAYPETPTCGCEEAHVARMIETAQLLAENGDPAVRPASKANGPAEQVSGLPKLRRLSMLRELFAPKKGKVALAALALLMATSGTAFAAARGALPAPIQDAAARAASVVGIDVPSSNEADVDSVDEVNVDNVDDADQRNVDNVDDADQKNVDEGNVDNVDQGNVGDIDQADEGNVDEGASDDRNDAAADNVDDGGSNDRNDEQVDDSGDGASNGGGGSSQGDSGDGQN